ncbi:MAG: PHP domain-containing protein [Bacteroidia bacterium]|nr:PHP domain-containing protein [Bacteroidia bacterium]
MDNRDIAKTFQLLGKIMELHGENQFKTRSYANAYMTIRKWPDALSEMSHDAIAEIPGVGKAIYGKIIELLETGEIQTLNKYLEMTPPGIVDLLQMKGFGPKKVKTVWEELGIESAGELLYAVKENRLIELKGFGAKTQEALRIQLEYHIESADKLHYAVAQKIADRLMTLLDSRFNDELTQFTGAIYRKEQVINQIDIITTISKNAFHEYYSTIEEGSIIGEKYHFMNIFLNVIYSKRENFHYELVKSSTAEDFFNSLKIPSGQYDSEISVFTDNQLPYYIPEFREDENVRYISNYRNSDNVVSFEDIKGCIHNHSTYSDGLNTIEEMIQAASEKSYEYFVLTDHSKSAFYANGLQIERLFQQLEEVRQLDQSNPDIKLFSGIESDILANGDLDYPDDVLAELDVVIASVHSNLKMDEEKATNRLLAAIENPFTSILGHPTGRLLLSRKGYPVDHKKIIDACAANNVCIEINASPYRLDLDWRWIQYAMEKDILLSINPDAHSVEGINDIFFGVCAARKGGLSKYSCLNAFDVEEFEEWLIEQHQKR